jgi:hypothetical protein
MREVQCDVLVLQSVRTRVDDVRRFVRSLFLAAAFYLHHRCDPEKLSLLAARALLIHVDTA